MQEKLLGDEGKVIIWAFAIALVRALLTKGKTWWEAGIVWLVATVLGCAAGFITLAFELGESWAILAAVTAALMGENAASGLIKLSQDFADDPVKTVQTIWNVWRGRNGGGGV